MPTVLLAVVLVLVVGCGDSSWSAAAPAPPRGEIVFSRVVEPSILRSNLYVAALDGSRPRLLARHASQAAVSPDGRQIAFVRDHAIWVMHRDGSGQRQLTNPGSRGTKNPALQDYTPTWSPDGRTLYFGRFVRKTESSSIFSVRPDGGLLRPVTKNVGTSVAFPTCSPDGRLIVFAESSDPYHGNDTTLSAVTTAGRRTSVPFRSSLASATTRSMTEDRPAWSPDGRRLAYQVFDVDAWNVRKNGASGIYVSTDGARPRRIAPPPGKTDAYSPAWSPDAHWIAFVHADAIWLVQYDGTGLRLITRTGAEAGDLAWLPPA